MSGETLSRTVPRISHDVNCVSWNYSYSWTNIGTSISIGQVGILTSLTGGILYLKASFARLTLNSQDLLYIAWLQSLMSAT